MGLAAGLVSRRDSSVQGVSTIVLLILGCQGLLLFDRGGME